MLFLELQELQMVMVGILCCLWPMIIGSNGVYLCVLLYILIKPSDQFSCVKYPRYVLIAAECCSRFRNLDSNAFVRQRFGRHWKTGTGGASMDVELCRLTFDSCDFFYSSCQIFLWIFEPVFGKIH